MKAAVEMSMNMLLMIIVVIMGVLLLIWGWDFIKESSGRLVSFFIYQIGDKAPTLAQNA